MTRRYAAEIHQIGCYSRVSRVPTYHLERKVDVAWFGSSARSSPESRKVRPRLSFYLRCTSATVFCAGLEILYDVLDIRKLISPDCKRKRLKYTSEWPAK